MLRGIAGLNSHVKSESSGGRCTDACSSDLRKTPTLANSNASGI